MVAQSLKIATIYSMWIEAIIAANYLESIKKGLQFAQSFFGKYLSLKLPS